MFVKTLAKKKRINKQKRSLSANYLERNWTWVKLKNKIITGIDLGKGIEVEIVYKNRLKTLMKAAVLLLEAYMVAWEGQRRFVFGGNHSQRPAAYIQLFKLYKSYYLCGLHICVPLAARLCYSFKCSGFYSFYLSFLALINIGSTLCLHQRSKSTVNPMAYYIVHFYGHDLQARTLALLHL